MSRGEYGAAARLLPRIRHQLLPVGQTPQDGEVFPETVGEQAVPVLHQIEGAVVDRHGLQPARLGLLFDPSAGVVGLALRAAELGFAVSLVAGDERHLQGGRKRGRSITLAQVSDGGSAPAPLRRSGRLLSALAVCAADFQVILFGDEERLGLSVLNSGVFRV